MRKKDDLTPRGWLSLLSVCVAVSARTALERAPSAAGMVLATLAIVLPPLLAMVVFPTPQVQWHRLAGWMELDVLRIHGEHIGSIATVRIGDWMLCLMPLVTVIFKLSPA